MVDVGSREKGEWRVLLAEDGAQSMIHVQVVYHGRPSPWAVKSLHLVETTLHLVETTLHLVETTLLGQSRPSGQ